MGKKKEPKLPYREVSGCNVLEVGSETHGSRWRDLIKNLFDVSHLEVLDSVARRGNARRRLRGNEIASGRFVAIFYRVSSWLKNSTIVITARASVNAASP